MLQIDEFKNPKFATKVTYYIHQQLQLQKKKTQAVDVLLFNTALQ